MKKIHPNVIEILCKKYRLALKNAPTWNCKSAKTYFEYIMNAYLIENENKFLLQLRVIQQCFYHQIDTKTNWGKKQLVDLLNETLNKYQGE